MTPIISYTSSLKFLKFPKPGLNLTFTTSFVQPADKICFISSLLLSRLFVILQVPTRLHIRFLFQNNTKLNQSTLQIKKLERHAVENRDLSSENSKLEAGSKKLNSEIQRLKRALEVA